MNLVKNLVSIFKLLTKSIRQVFMYIQEFSRHYLHVFPCIETIATKCGLGKRTVSRAINYMKKNGWIAVKKRPYQSNLYFMPNELIALDLNDKSLWNNPYYSFEDKKKTQTETSSVSPSGRSLGMRFGTVLENLCNKDNISTREVPGHASKKEEKAPLLLKDIPMDEKSKINLSKRFSECSLVEAIKDFFWYLGKKKVVNSPFAFIASRAAAHSRPRQPEPAKTPKTDWKVVMNQMFTNGQHYNGAECFLNNEGIAFQRGMKHRGVKFSDAKFKDRINQIVEDFGIAYV